MNFFEQQDRARRETTTLIGLFTASVVFVGICIYFAVMLTINTTSLRWAVFDDRVCQPIVPVSATIYPRTIATSPATIPANQNCRQNSLGENFRQTFQK